MTGEEYFKQLAEKKVDNKKVEKIQTLYETVFPETVKKVISNCGKTAFLDDGYRVLSLDEIADAETELHVDFKGKGIIPFVDCGENDFIVYHFNDNIWSKFNIVDETIFKKKNTFKELLK